MKYEHDDEDKFIITIPMNVSSVMQLATLAHYNSTSLYRYLRGQLSEDGFRTADDYNENGVVYVTMENSDWKYMTLLSTAYISTARVDPSLIDEMAGDGGLPIEFIMHMLAELPKTVHKIAELMEVAEKEYRERP